jgi:hypothetical protein
MVLDRDRKPPDPRVKRWPLGHRPRTQHIARLQAKVEVQGRRVVQLHDKAMLGDHS